MNWRKNIVRIKSFFFGNKEESINRKITRRTIYSFLSLIFLYSLSVYSWKWIRKQKSEQGIYQPLRKVLNSNETVFSKIYSLSDLVPEYPVSQAVKNARVNGFIGMRSKLDSLWQLTIIRGSGDTLKLTLDDIKKLPKTELIFDFKCVEGWSQISHWGGVRFSDIAKHYQLGTKDRSTPDIMQNDEELYGYTGFYTPDSAYYVGLDMPSMFHPQTLLCYELNGKTLPMNQGYPLRLICPVKYGIKSIKRIGTIYFSDSRPRDYWYERGYDYYSGL